jgi:predicted DNA-binding transcriptional regulator AlpA
MGHDKWLRAKACADRLSIGVSTFWRWVKLGRIPPGTRFSKRCTAWKESTIAEFEAFCGKNEQGNAREGDKEAQ